VEGASMKNSFVALLAVAGTLLWASPAAADNKATLTLTGKVTAANSKQVNVLAHQQDQIFIINDGFAGVFDGGQRHSTDYLKKGMTVTVTYNQAKLFGSFQALRIDVGQPQFSLPVATPGGPMTLPKATP
jgi:ABC-type oligopeptide transport system substrate-binding subunit